MKTKALSYQKCIYTLVYLQMLITAERPPQHMLDSAQALIATGIKQHILSEDYKLVGHSQASPTECPGTKLMAEIRNWDHYSADGL